jgi:transcriptional regulator with XRE-family HTH domain
MNQTFLQILLRMEEMTQVEFARLMGWTPQRVWYLVSGKCKSFPFEELDHVRQHLNLSDTNFIKALDEYFGQFR